MKFNFKTPLMAGALLLGALVSFTSCDDDDNDNKIKDVPEAFTDALSGLYPNASGVEWERDGNYTKADFKDLGKDVEVWFTDKAEWAMTETDLGKSMSEVAPEVAEAFYASDYSGWTVDDIDLYQRPDIVFYVIDVESSTGKDVDLYYGWDGKLLKTADGNRTPDIRPDTKI